MFAWRPSVILAAIERSLPELFTSLKLIEESFVAKDFERIPGLFEELESVSIDKGVLEKVDNIALLCAEDLDWSDVGSWDSWVGCLEKNQPEVENVVQGDVKFLSSKGCLAISSGKFIAGVGLKDLVIVETEDSILVCDRHKSQQVREVVDFLKARGRDELL